MMHIHVKEHYPNLERHRRQKQVPGGITAPTLGAMGTTTVVKRLVEAGGGGECWQTVSWVSLDSHTADYISSAQGIFPWLAQKEMRSLTLDHTPSDLTLTRVNLCAPFAEPQRFPRQRWRRSFSRGVVGLAFPPKSVAEGGAYFPEIPRTSSARRFDTIFG